MKPVSAYPAEGTSAMMTPASRSEEGKPHAEGAPVARSPSRKVGTPATARATEAVGKRAMFEWECPRGHVEPPESAGCNLKRSASPGRQVEGVEGCVVIDRIPLT